MEYIEGCNLHDTVLRHKYNEKHIAFISHEVLKALKFLHSQEIAHRDIKTQNIMLTLEGNVKLVDFGLSCEMGLGPRTSLVGSPYWMPPEMIKNQPYTYNVDIWSLGICILELFLGAVPYAHSGILCMFKVATEGLIELIPNNIELEAINFIKKCLEYDPQKRPSSAELCQDEWVNRPGLQAGLKNVITNIFLSSITALKKVQYENH